MGNVLKIASKQVRCKQTDLGYVVMPPEYDLISYCDPWHCIFSKIFANNSLTLKLRTITYWYCCHILGGLKWIQLCGPQFLIRTQRTIWGLTHGKNKFIKENTERIPQGRCGPDQERHCCWNDEVWGFSRQGFCIFISVGVNWQFWLTVTSYITACCYILYIIYMLYIYTHIYMLYMYCTYLSHNSVWYRLQLHKVSWGHSCASRTSV